MPKHLPLLSGLLGLLAAAPGCFWTTTKSEGDTMRRDIKALDGRLATKEQALDGQIGELKKVLEDATRVLKRNSADLGADVDQLRDDVRKATGLTTALNASVNELKLATEATRKESAARLDAVEARLAQLEAGKPSAQSTPDDLWRLGAQAFEAARYAEAIDLFKRLVLADPKHDRADDAQYFRGQAYTKLSQWDDAIGAYQRLYEKYPDSTLADDGLYFAALAAQQLKNCGEARAYLGVLKQKFPGSNVARQADELDKQLKKDAKNKAACQS